jgi:hypothetical protein
MRTSWALPLPALAMGLWGIVGCGEGASDQQGPPLADPAAPATSELRTCPSTRRLVCGTDGQTYRNACLAGGSRNVAHTGACADFLCNGVTCADGFHCESFSVFGAPVDQCVADEGGVRRTAVACSCPAGSHCVQAPSGATSCEADAPPPAPSDCSTKVCPAGQSCKLFFVFGAPVPACV